MPQSTVVPTIRPCSRTGRGGAGLGGSGSSTPPPHAAAPRTSNPHRFHRRDSSVTKWLNKRSLLHGEDDSNAPTDPSPSEALTRLGMLPGRLLAAGRVELSARRGRHLRLGHAEVQEEVATLCGGEDPLRVLHAPSAVERRRSAGGRKRERAIVRGAQGASHLPTEGYIHLSPVDERSGRGRREENRPRTGSSPIRHVSADRPTTAPATCISAPKRAVTTK
jgi:hypothetical protein